MKDPTSIVLRGLVLAALLATPILSARDIAVKNPGELSAALKAAGAGDSVILAKGTWTDAHLAVERGGSPEQPLTIRAESPGETILTGSSSLKINAPHVTVDGLFFYHGAIRKGAVIEFNSHHGIVRNTAVVDYNPADFETKYYWVFFSGDNNLVDRCYFKGKNHLEPLIGNAIEDARYNGVLHSYIKNIPYADVNGREDIRVWGAGKFDAGAEGGAFFTIEGNLFERADGEGAEIISLKSNHNQVLNNTVMATRGCINIRQGSSNLIRGNIVLGQGRPGTQGLRMSGLHNTVQGNYVSGCDYGIRVATGEYIAGALTPNYEPKHKTVNGQTVAKGAMATYAQVKDLTLSDNVTVGIKDADLEVGFEYQRHWPNEQMVLLPENCVIKNNRFVRPHGGDSVIGTIPPATPPFDQFHFAPNRYEGNQLVGGKNTFSPAAQGCASEPLPAGWTEAAEQAGFKPLTAADVGPAWVRTFRAAGKFTMEDDMSCYRAASPSGNTLEPAENKNHPKKHARTN